MTKVVVIIPTADGEVMPECLEALRHQNHPCQIMIETLAPEHFSDNPHRNKSHNSTRTRNAARLRLLGSGSGSASPNEKSDSGNGTAPSPHPSPPMGERAPACDVDYVLWVDSDTVLPLNAVEEFLKQPQFKVQAGWSRMRGSEIWSAGRWVADDVLPHFKHVQPSLVKADYAGLGCLFMRKEVLAVPFTSGLDKFCKTADGQTHYLGPCVAFGNALFEKGIQIYMNGSVVCRHLA